MNDLPVSRLEPHPLALRCASFCLGPEREAAETALAADVAAHGVRVPLAVAPKARGRGYWVLDGCSRLEAAKAAGLPRVPVSAMSFDDENAMAEEVYRLNTVRKPFTSSQRVMLWVDVHLGAVLESYSPKAGRKKIGPNGPIFSVNGTAERLGVSHHDVSAAAELARCVNGSLVPCTVKGGRSVRDATADEIERLQAVYASVLAGRTPLRRWLAAFAGMASEDGGRESGGAPKVNWEKFGERTTKSLRTLFDGWRKMPPAYRATTLDALADAVDRAPEDVLDLLRAKLAERKGGAE